MAGLPTDLSDFPDYMQRVMGDDALDFAMPACIGPVSYRDLDAVRADIANLKAARRSGRASTDAFMTAASPGRDLGLSAATSTTRATRSTSPRSPTR